MSRLEHATPSSTADAVAVDGLDDEAIVTHMIATIDAAGISDQPYEHAFVEGIFPEAFYAAVEAAFPAPDDSGGPAMRRVAERRTQQDDYSDRRLTVEVGALPPDHLAALPVALRQAHRVMTNGRLAQYLIRHFGRTLGPVLSALVARAGIKGDRIRFDLEKSCEIIYDGTGFELLPHTDGNKKLVTSLIYVPGPGAPESLGTHLYRLRPGAAVPAGAATGHSYLDWEQTVDVGEVPYRRNCMLVFARSAASLHGVPRVEGSHPRRLIQTSVMHSGSVRYRSLDDQDG